MSMRGRRSAGIPLPAAAAPPLYGQQIMTVAIPNPQIMTLMPQAAAAPPVTTQATVHEHTALIPNPSVPLYLRNNVDDPLLPNSGVPNISDISTLECESVQADPNWTPAREATFVPPLEIYIPRCLSISVEQHRSSVPDARLSRRPDLTRQTSCQSRLESNCGNDHCDDNDDDRKSQFSYYTSPTDLYLSDESQIPLRVIHRHPTKKGMVKRELKKIFGKMEALRRQSKQQKQPPHTSGTMKDVDSLGGCRGCLI
jgi:hypothetical protein